MLYRDSRRKFLKNFPRGYKGHVAKLFYKTIRAGLNDANEIAKQVLNITANCYDWKQTLHGVIWSRNNQAVEFAEWCVDHLNASEEDKKAYDKMSQAEVFVERNTDKVPPSDKQIATLKSYEHIGDYPETMVEASKLINYYKNNEHIINFKICDMPACEVDGDAIGLRMLRLSMFLGRLSVMLKLNTFQMIGRLYDNNNVLFVFNKDERVLSMLTQNNIQNAWAAICWPSSSSVRFIEQGDM